MAIGFDGRFLVRNSLFFGADVLKRAATRDCPYRASWSCGRDAMHGALFLEVFKGLYSFS